MSLVSEILGVLSSSMAILDGCDEVVIGLDFAGQLVAHDLDQIVAGQQIGGSMAYALVSMVPAD